MGEYLGPRVRLRPGDVARRHEASWRGLTAEAVQFTASEGFEYDFTAPCHLLIAADRGIRIRGESRVDGVVTSSRRDIGRTLSFIPKLIGIFVALIVAGPWMLAVMLDYMRQVFNGIPGLIG